MLVVVFKSSTRLHSGFSCNFGPETDDKDARQGRKRLEISLIPMSHFFQKRLRNEKD